MRQVRHELRTGRRATIGATTGSSHTGAGRAGGVCRTTTSRYGITTATARAVTVPTVNSAAPRTTATRSPSTSRPTATVEAPTASRAIDRHP